MMASKSPANLSVKQQANIVHEAQCPSCGRMSRFSYGGEQQWPLRVARMIGVPSTISLWNCHNCHSTFSEMDLMF
jgi:hypothetical protein